jgi:hypothetical protein
MTSGPAIPAPRVPPSDLPPAVVRECRGIGRFVGVAGTIVGVLGMFGGIFATTGEYGEIAPDWTIIGGSVVLIVTALWAGALLLGLAEVIEQLRRR